MSVNTLFQERGHLKKNIKNSHRRVKTSALKFSVKSWLPASQVFNCSQRKLMRHACVSFYGMLLTGNRSSAHGTYRTELCEAEH